MLRISTLALPPATRHPTRLACACTAWSLIYLTLHARKSLCAPRHPIPLALSAGAMACAALYGTEYFVYQN
ncbi:hypothetical protein J3R82DRAFT_4874 [Butyriboletus roseoflavus]|nr:hypothetical protein J3R82DRAFT_4874 [Butyriboletus roseoflavus]